MKNISKNYSNNNKFFDGAIVKVNEVRENFIIDKRNDFLKRTSYYSPDGKWIAVINDGDFEVQIERNE